MEKGMAGIHRPLAVSHAYEPAEIGLRMNMVSMQARRQRRWARRVTQHADEKALGGGPAGLPHISVLAHDTLDTRGAVDPLPRVNRHLVRQGSWHC